ncbi:MAG: helix-turn-helix domain-containing protein [Acidimicrobiales bacterium]
MLLTHDPAATAARLESGSLACPVNRCGGQLAPWGHARSRALRLGSGRGEAHTPRRARCRACRRTQVLVPTRSYPRHPDTVETVGLALLAAAGGLGHRRVAKLVGLPATTVRGWLRRARTNADAVRSDATVATCRLDPMAGPFDPTPSPLGDMLDAVGRAVQAWVLLFGPVPAPWQVAVTITRAAILAPVPRPRWNGRF